MTLRVLIADDHPVVRVGLRGVLAGAAGIELVGEAGSGEEALVLVAILGPDVVLMDLRMPGLGGLRATACIAENHPAVRVLVLTTYDTDADVVRAEAAGAVGYLLKDTPMDVLLAAVRAAARGEPVPGRRLAPRPHSAERLTPREIQVLELVARGMSNVDIGRQLYIGEATVKTHLLRLFGKLGVNDRTAAVTVALSRGLLETG